MHSLPFIPPPPPFHQAPVSDRTKPCPQNPKTPSMNNKSEQKANAVAIHQPRQPPPFSNTRTDGVAPTRSGDAGAEESSCCGRERMKRHWVDVAGGVWIPDIWGQEDLLKDWIDCSDFDSSLVGSSIMSSRESLVEEGRRASSTREQLLIL